MLPSSPMKNYLEEHKGFMPEKHNKTKKMNLKLPDPKDLINSVLNYSQNISISNQATQKKGMISLKNNIVSPSEPKRGFINLSKAKEIKPVITQERPKIRI